MTEEKLDYLRKKSADLPTVPGIYIMKDKNGKVIYVGKSRSLKNRVSQYFHLSKDSNIKTIRMVSKVNDFDVILCDTEIEALSLENIKIKQYSPKYNILLKDSKSYPYIKVDVNEKFPRITMNRKRMADGAKYFGPYSGASTVYNIIGILDRTLKLPKCNYTFPKDIEKVRPCIYKQMNKCVSPCDNSISEEEYRALINCAVSILRGNIAEATKELKTNMFLFSEQEKFEDAARCRDAIESLKRLKDEQKVVGKPGDEFDIVSVYSDELCTVIVMFYIRSGIIYDKDVFSYGAYEITENEYEYMTSFLFDLYSKREYIPPLIMTTIDFTNEEAGIIEKFLSEKSGGKVSLRIPKIGEYKKLCDLVYNNAIESAKQYKQKAEQDAKVLLKLSDLLSLDCIPTRIEAYDISNLGSEYITAGMVVYENGKPKKKDYRYFRIKNTDNPDDYFSMSQVLERRLLRLNDSDDSFSSIPDLILLDGGKTHVSVVKKLLRELQTDIPVFGMVKDEHHKTRTIVTENGEISIAKDQSVFTLIYGIQEEVHRFTVSRMDTAKRKSLKKSVLEDISGIGSKKAKLLLDYFKTLEKVKNATPEELKSVKGISKTDAQEIIDYFRK